MINKKNNITDKNNIKIKDTSTNNYIEDPIIKKKYIGCFNDGNGRSLFGYRFPEKVKSVAECIELGKKSNYDYISLKNGNECWAGNSNYDAYGEVEKKFCNIPCEKANSGMCGGSIFNEVYKTDYKNLTSNTYDNKILNKMNPVITSINERENSSNANKNEYTSNIKDSLNADMIEEFNNITEEDYKELKLINKNLYYKDFTYVEPININYLFIYIIVIIILVFILVKYFEIKNKLKLINK